MIHEERLEDLYQMWDSFASADFAAIMTGLTMFKKRREKCLSDITEEDARMKDHERTHLAKMAGCSKTAPLLEILDAIEDALLLGKNMEDDEETSFRMARSALRKSPQAYAFLGGVMEQ